MELKDEIHWSPIWDIDKFLDPTGQVAKLSQRGMAIARLNQTFRHQYIGRTRRRGNLLLNAGINVAWA